MQHNYITSLQNERIKKVIELHTTKGRKKQQRYSAEGERILEGFSRNHKEPLELFVTQEKLFVAQKLFSIDPFIVTDAIMKKISTATTPSGIVAIFQYTHQNELPTLTGPVLVLCSINDPGNMGTLIRSSVACNVTTLILVGGCDPYNPKVIQASAGALADATLLQLTHEQIITYKKTHTFCALTLHNGDSITSITTKNVLLFVGNEAHGLSQEEVHMCDIRVTLPMSTHTESFNAAVAGSIALFLMCNR